MNLGMRLAMVVILAPVSALASTGRVAVLEPSYEIVETGKAPATIIKDVEDKVKDAAREAGFEVVEGDAVAAAAKQSLNSPGSKCSSKSCLQKTAQSLEADEALFVSVKDYDGRYEIAVFSSAGPSGDATPYGTDVVMLSTVAGLVKSFLSEKAAKKNETGSQATAEPKSQEKHKESTKKVSMGAFLVFAGVTGALGLSYGIVDIVAYNKGKDLRDTLPSKRTQSDYNSFASAQIADRVLFTAFLTSAALTTIVGFVTDFKGDQDKIDNATARYSLSPSIDANGGGIVLKGSF